MYRIRYYDQVIHPDHFKTKGLGGRVIVMLNWLRWKLETYIQKKVLKWLAKGNSLPKSRVSELMRSFDLDVKAEKIEKARTSPLHEALEQPPTLPPTRADRYAAPHLDGAIAEHIEEQTGLPLRPEPLNDLIGRYAFNVRAKKYARGLRFHVADPDGDFEPLTEDKSGYGNTEVAAREGVSRDSDGRVLRLGIRSQASVPTEHSSSRGQDR